MNAITFQGVGDVRAKDVADPKIVDPTDVVLRITTSAVCGSDLHQYHGRGGALVQTGAIMGHEFMGTVDDLGAGVRNLRRGDRVIVPFSVSCGGCEWCRRRLPTQCATTGRAGFGGRFGDVWGGGEGGGGRGPFAERLWLPPHCAPAGGAVGAGRCGQVWGGGQAEWVRVPFAEHLCEKVPAEM